MQLAIFNGSPRGNNSNTQLLLGHFQKGFESFGGEITTSDLLILEKDIGEQIQHFKTAENILLAFPLYVDSVPGMVKNFIEQIGNFDGTGRNIFFLVHSGFPEGIHSKGVIRYLELLVKRWNMTYLGTILKPGSEGIRMHPNSRNTKLFMNFKILGSELAKTGTLDKKIINKMKKPNRLPGFVLFIIKLLNKAGKMNSYWDTKLKENNAFERRFDTPYL
jgi:multimeric flavodoxin WrbA